jgi:hypothetical protein
MFMKLYAGLLMLVFALFGCASNERGAPTSSSLTPIAEQRLAISDFKRQGVRVGYTLAGNLEFIEATGYAPVWGSSQNAEQQAYRVAELEAKKALNDFINKENITSSVSVRTIAQNLERAQDKRNNSQTTTRSGDPDRLVSLDEDAEKSGSTQASKDENSALRKDAVSIATRINSTITTQNRGILGGLYLVEGKVINDGKNVQVVYRWDRKSDGTRKQLRNLMSQ